jgi:hypothetical protein
MIGYESLYDEIQGAAALRCPDGLDTAALIHVAEAVAAGKIPAVSSGPESVEYLWAWLDKRPVNIYARIEANAKKGRKPDWENEISKLSGQVNAVFKKGAGGAQIFVRYSELESFANELLAIRDGLFFNKDLSLGLDISEIGAADWSGVFAQMNRIRADALLLYLSENKKVAHDFVGRIYGLFENFDPGFGGEMHFMTGNDPARIEQIWRLAMKMRPEIREKIRFFI